MSDRRPETDRAGEASPTASVTATTRSRRQRLRAWLARDDGAASALVVGLAVAFLALAGLVIDGGRAVNARAEILDDAEQAARAGANEVDIETLRVTGKVQVDQSRARQAAAAYLTARGYSAGRITATATQGEVSVSVSETVPTALLSLVFIRSFDVEGTAVARAALGIDDEINP